MGLYLIEKGTPRDVKLSIYERINTGGTTLVPQEIRHAIFQGAATKLLDDLVTFESFKRATNDGISSLRMADKECILRFLSFYLTDYRDYQTKEMDKFLHNTMDRLSKLKEEDVQKIKMDFDRAMKAAFKIFDKDAFRKPIVRAQINKALFETWSSCLAKLPEPKLEILAAKRKPIVQGLKALMKDEDFVTSISSATNDVKKVRKRFSAIEGLIGEVLT